MTDDLAAVQSFVTEAYDSEYRVKDTDLFRIELESTLDLCTPRVDAALRLASEGDAEEVSNI